MNPVFTGLLFFLCLLIGEMGTCMLEQTSSFQMSLY